MKPLAGSGSARADRKRQCRIRPRLATPTGQGQDFNIELTQALAASGTKRGRDIGWIFLKLSLPSSSEAVSCPYLQLWATGTTRSGRRAVWFHQSFRASLEVEVNTRGSLAPSTDCQRPNTKNDLNKKMYYGTLQIAVDAIPISLTDVGLQADSRKLAHAKAQYGGSSNNL